MASIRLNAPLTIAAGSVFPPLCFCAVAMRFYSRKIQRSGFGVDDWLTVPALILIIGISAAILRGVALQSVAYPTPAFSPENALTTTSFQQTVTRQVFLACELMQVLALGCIKMSCMFFYRRIFSTGNINTREIVWYCCTIFIGMWMTAFFFTLFLNCGVHITWLWGTLVDETHCPSTKVFQWPYAATDVLTDLIVLIFPIVPVWRLHMSVERKIGVTLVFFLGTLALMASLTRLAVYIEVLSVEFASTPPDEDLITTAGIYFIYLETGIGLLGCCLPTLYGLLTTNGLQSVVRSVASMLSLTANRSTDSVQPSDSKEFKQVASSQSSTNSQTQAEPLSTKRWHVEEASNLRTTKSDSQIV